MKQSTITTLALSAAGLALGAWALKRGQPYDFANRVVVITGGSRGLGLVIARQLAQEGARLAILARDVATLKQAAAEISAMGVEVLAIPCDVGKRTEVQQAIQIVAERYGRIDVLINNAGIIQVGPLDHMRIADFENALAVHLWGPLYTTLAVLPYMRRQGGGRIVNISSIGGKIAIPHLLPYSASKFALAGLSDGLRAELAADNIQVTTVFPGLMRTGSHLNALFKGRHNAEFTWFALFDALPISSIDARRAAQQIIAACRHGSPYLMISLPAQFINAFSVLFPDLFAATMAMVNRLLPQATGTSGDIRRSGWESQSRWAPSPLTYLADSAATANNELRGHAPPGRGNPMASR